jgi:hypothetical protein
MINFRCSKKMPPTPQTGFTRVSDYPKQLAMGLGGPRWRFAAVQEDFMQINLVARFGERARTVVSHRYGHEGADQARRCAAAVLLLSSTQDIHSSF